VSCQTESFPHPDLGEAPSPECPTVLGCRGTFTRTAPGDVGSIVVNPNCEPESSGGEPCPPECGPDGCYQCGSSWCCHTCDPPESCL
jgi:hypothetical protein